MHHLGFHNNAPVTIHADGTGLVECAHCGTREMSRDQVERLAELLERDVDEL